ncbi:hypothetical protein [Chryseobacterium arthrosphaerae]|uniref:hypothetical protein n=1 Tax=Chryseobacterium arthrosphaerae TaxID=651561 RepID=UPI001F4B5056|nr:hypothetical protein [Chryseobacterium arthrosphaerae]
MSRDIKIKNKDGMGFWIDKADIEVLSHFLIQIFDKYNLKSKNEIFDDMYDVLDFNRQGIRYSTTNIYLQFLETQDDINTMIRVLEDAKVLIAEQGEFITVDFINGLNQYRDKTEHWNWDKPIFTSSFIKVLDIMILMLKGKWQETDKRIWLKGHASEGFEET